MYVRGVFNDNIIIINNGSRSDKGEVPGNSPSSKQTIAVSIMADFTDLPICKAKWMV